MPQITFAQVLGLSHQDKTLFDQIVVPLLRSLVSGESLDVEGDLAPLPTEVALAVKLYLDEVGPLLGQAI